MDSQLNVTSDQPFRVALIAGEVAITGPGVALLLTPDAAARLARGLLEAVTEVVRAEPRSFAAPDAGGKRPSHPGGGVALRRFD
jgi:hypothetical protein